MAYYIVSKPEDLINVIIPHFNSYPLLTQKYLDFNLWSKVVDIVIRKEHLTPEGLDQIIRLKASINNGLSEKIINNFINTKDVKPFIGYVRGNFSASAIPDPN
jgi:hypothetical protein